MVSLRQCNFEAISQKCHTVMMATLAAAVTTTTIRQRRWVGGLPDSAQCGADQGVTHRCLGCRVPGRPEDPYFLSQKERYQHLHTHEYTHTSGEERLMALMIAMAMALNGEKQLFHHNSIYSAAHSQCLGTVLPSTSLGRGPMGSISFSQCFGKWGNTRQQ